jgi:hypothetical protein
MYTKFRNERMSSAAALLFPTLAGVRAYIHITPGNDYSREAEIELAHCMVSRFVYHRQISNAAQGRYVPEATCG